MLVNKSLDGAGDLAVAVSPFALALRGLKAAGCFGVLLVGLAERGAAQLPPQVRHSTHDFTDPLPGVSANAGLAEVWVDSKSPGDGFTYSVGTVEVERTALQVGASGSVLFSGQPITVLSPLLGFPNLPATGPASKQVIVVQCVDQTQNIVWQRFYYGFAENGNRRINARAISVWPSSDRSQTRIAICGESNHDTLPLDQLGLTGGFATVLNRGFVAVLNNAVDPQGQAAPELLWSYQIFSRNANGALNGETAVTDVSVRVENGVDVVTYCGITTCGVGNSGFGTLSTDPKLPFSAPANTCSPPLAGGNDDNGAGNWDGFVGRLERGNQASVDLKFHSMVGGGLKDGLFGIAEIDVDRFCVVGTSGYGPPPGTSITTSHGFPFTAGNQCLGPIPPNAPEFSVAVALVFNSAPTKLPPPTGPQPLILEWSRHYGRSPLGSEGDFFKTIGRDVVVQHRLFTGGTLAGLVIVGESDDPGLVASATSSGPDLTLAGQGDTDGFVKVLVSDSGDSVYGTFYGGPSHDGLVGVSSWSEFPDHFSVVGYSLDPSSGDTSFRSATYWISAPLTLTRDVVLAAGVGLDYRPTLLGFFNAGLGDWQGGGVAVDPAGRITACGGRRTGSAIAPSATQALPLILAGRASTSTSESFRVVMDALPGGCGRTDGTGSSTGVAGIAYPVAPFAGGTTPDCAVQSFGEQIGVSAPVVPALRRMHLDYIGPDWSILGSASGQLLTFVVDRPPLSSLISVSAWQVDFPGVVGGAGFPAPVALPNGTVLWTTSSPAFVIEAAGISGSLVTSWQLPGAGSGYVSTPMSIQLVCLLAQPVLGLGGGGCSGLSDTAASPALWLTLP